MVKADHQQLEVGITCRSAKLRFFIYKKTRIRRGL